MCSYKTKNTEILLRTLLALSLASLLIACEQVQEIKLISPQQGEIQAFFTEPARTRLTQSWPVRMPVSGNIKHISHQPGDQVTIGQHLVEIDQLPFQESVTEAKAIVAELEQQLHINAFDNIEKTIHTETLATIDAARDALQASKAKIESQTIRRRQARKDLQRDLELSRENSISQQQLDNSRLLAETADIDLKREAFTHEAMNTLFTAVKLGPQYVEQWLARKKLQREVIVQQLEQARSRLALAKYQLQLARITAPITGIVLKRHEQGNGFFTAGHPLLLLGNRNDLEVISEVLTEDAMRLTPGLPVELTAYKQKEILTGTVKRIEPAGFSKRSSLGVEQQKVNVIISLQNPPQNLGIGYRLQARFIINRQRKALIIPRFSVLQNEDDEYYVFKLKSGKLFQQKVSIGISNDRQIEILSGLEPIDRIVATPDATLSKGQRISENNG